MSRQWRSNDLIPNGITHLKHITQFHGRLVTGGYLHADTNYWASLLLRLCSRFQATPTYAHLIFRAAPFPDALVFAAMLKYFSKVGARDHVVHLFDEMRALGLRPDATAYVALIKSSGLGGALLHAHMVKLGLLDCDVYVCNAILDMYAKGGQLETARRLFDEMTEPSTADWNSMIYGYWKWGVELKARELFNAVPAKNVITWTSMVTGYAKMGDLEMARKYFESMPEKSVVSWNAMLSGYAQNGMQKAAMELFEEMASSGSVRPNEKTWVAVISSCTSLGDASMVESLVQRLENSRVNLNCFIKTALLDMFAHCGRLESARQLFDELGLQRSSVTWNAMISAYSKNGDLGPARDLFNQMPNRDLVSWNTMISGYTQNGQSASAIELFKGLTNAGKLKPDEVTITATLSACGNLGAIELGHWVLNFGKENQIELGISGLNALLFMYCRCGYVKDAWRIFHEMETKDVVSYNTLISGLAAHGQGSEALKLLSKMKEEGVKPDHITYLGILTACSHGGLVEEGWQVFNSIDSPSVDHYASMVDLLGRVGELDRVKNLINSMPMKPHAGLFGSVLNACRIHKRVDLGEMAATKLFELEPLNSGNHVLLSNLYASLNRWNDADRVRQGMIKMGLRKVTGSSWVEHEGKVHRFVVGDRSHERSEDVYDLLLEIEAKMKSVGYVVDESYALRDVGDEEKEEMVRVHSERLAICFSILVSESGSTIRVMKNLRVCSDCHTAIKMISKIEMRKIVVRDNNRFHCFVDGQCSCNDYW